MAPLLDVRVSELFASSFDRPHTRIQLSWSTDEPLEDKLKIVEQSLRHVGKATSLSLSAAFQCRIWRHIDHAERMRSVVISSQELVKLPACRHRRSTSHR
ncbi:BZ3500_MvSof-1268-A1-R1_Chr7-2g09499 [Microbotryum saponariae]|uniref:BZ3500_MvSof-1268-A1-R1_Chr7-2g09499 protein n=1 Tax=Microbotryum saponariae TaxID=289078 RepID=A0A2X0L741_9BASI|nr:BZ3500_MvSof-1268-A1-R1_Chr8-2g10254 [Microbotryum saponariae]SCZ99361.1 BZ3501_MvSof-1269-A2-R1_Chr7-1g09199 [Microbotryum saponariae]SDA02052.1 BZ3501_MvSof-1269-A2-R1_Chr8-2g10004 [Microbotryum saponariae]SDA02571.1 BZ3500_MvSof-1268-A1-R1_Chr7-2g09499 [Microbotryum saponariae]